MKAEMDLFNIVILHQNLNFQSKQVLKLINYTTRECSLKCKAVL